jgi:hypothetical protein
MILAIVLVISAIAALGTILRLAAIQHLQVSRERAGNVGSIRPIDIEAFRNLVDAAEDEYLRCSLAPAKFRAVRRARLRAMAAYVQAFGENAVVLVRQGELALASGDPHSAEAAQQQVDDALRLRRNATVALAQIYFALLWPHSSFAAVRVADRYEQLSRSAMLLGRLQNPAVAVRLSASRAR